MSPHSVSGDFFAVRFPCRETLPAEIAAEGRTTGTSLFYIHLAAACLVVQLPTPGTPTNQAGMDFAPGIIVQRFKFRLFWRPRFRQNRPGAIGADFCELVPLGGRNLLPYVRGCGHSGCLGSVIRSAGSPKAAPRSQSFSWEASVLVRPASASCPPGRLPEYPPAAPPRRCARSPWATGCCAPAAAASGYAPNTAESVHRRHSDLRPLRPYRQNCIRSHTHLLLKFPRFPGGQCDQD